LSYCATARNAGKVISSAIARHSQREPRTAARSLRCCFLSDVPFFSMSIAFSCLQKLKLHRAFVWTVSFAHLAACCRLHRARALLLLKPLRALGVRSHYAGPLCTPDQSPRGRDRINAKNPLPLQAGLRPRGHRRAIGRQRLVVRSGLLLGSCRGEKVRASTRMCQAKTAISFADSGNRMVAASAALP
jgi:hypothetical protein